MRYDVFATAHERMLIQPAVLPVGLLHDGKKKSGPPVHNRCTVSVKEGCVRYRNCPVFFRSWIRPPPPPAGRHPIHPEQTHSCRGFMPTPSPLPRTGTFVPSLHAKPPAPCPTLAQNRHIGTRLHAKPSPSPSTGIFVPYFMPNTPPPGASGQAHSVF